MLFICGSMVDFAAEKTNYCVSFNKYRGNGLTPQL